MPDQKTAPSWWAKWGSMLPGTHNLLCVKQKSNPSSSRWWSRPAGVGRLPTSIADAPFIANGPASIRPLTASSWNEGAARGRGSRGADECTGHPRPINRESRIPCGRGSSHHHRHFCRSLSQNARAHGCRFAVDSAGSSRGRCASPRTAIHGRVCSANVFRKTRWSSQFIGCSQSVPTAAPLAYDKAEGCPTKQTHLIHTRSNRV